MVTVLTHLLEGEDRPRLRTLYYAQLHNASFAGLWRVGFMVKGDEPFSEIRHTFAVDASCATIKNFEQRRTDVAQWLEVAKMHWVGDWCEVYEVLWSDAPYTIRQFKNGAKARVGISRTPNPSRSTAYLWYVAFGEGVEDDAYQAFDNVFLVDVECLEYFEKLSNNRYNWSRVSWAQPIGGGDPRLSTSHVERPIEDFRTFKPR